MEEPVIIEETPVEEKIEETVEEKVGTVDEVTSPEENVV